MDNKNKKEKFVYNSYTEKEMESYREMTRNMDFLKRNEVEREFNLSQIIILTSFLFILITLTVSGFFMKKLGSLFYFHGFFLLLMISIISFIYSLKNIKNVKWYILPMILSFIQIVLSLSNMFIDLY